VHEGLFDNANSMLQMFQEVLPAAGGSLATRAAGMAMFDAFHGDSFISWADLTNIPSPFARNPDCG
jgi:hypothetical protein